MRSLPGLPTSRPSLKLDLAATLGAIPVSEIVAAKDGARLKTWQLSPSLHCSIIGTCLTASELRQLLVKVGDHNAKSATDHILHSRGVQLAGQRDGAGKLLNKALDNRHGTAIRQTSKLSAVADLRTYWREAFDRGDIAGAYWAVLSHPATDADLIKDVFGEVHMLSHLVGSASRLDIARLNQLQAALDEANRKLARQEQRLAEAASERAKLQSELGALKQRVSELSAKREPAPLPIDKTRDSERKAPDQQSRNSALAEQLQAAREEAKLMAARAAEAEKLAAQLQSENEALEARKGGDRDTPSSLALDGQVVLYVGGRRRLHDRLKSVAAEAGASIMFHDGGLEDNTSLLPAYVGRADLVVFPVDNISHAGMGITKKLCYEGGKPLVPMRSAGLGSFAAVIAEYGQSRP